VEKAYSLLVNESNPSKEKGYVASLYSGIKRCLTDKHIHLQTKIEYIDGLIKRAEPELNGRYVSLLLCCAVLLLLFVEILYSLICQSVAFSTKYFYLTWN
jgi:hypothetical protein